MPDISKINAVAIADIEKLDSILAANIEKVNGLVFSTAPAFVGLLDTYTGAAAGYSTRRLASATTVLMRVRRETAGGAGDDDEADVAYDTNNELSLDSAISNPSALVTSTTLGQFLNVGTVNGTTYTNPDNLTVTASCFVDTWMDQSGNANDAEQNIFGSQPQIHDGTVNTDLIKENGKPAVVWVIPDKLATAGNVLNSNDLSLTFVGARTSASRYNHTVVNFTGGANTAIYGSQQDQYLLLDGGVVASGSGGPGTAQHMYYFDTDGTNYEFRLNATAVYSGTRAYGTGTNALQLGYYGGGGGDIGPIQEIVLWSGAKSDTDRNGIETDIMTYFSIT